MRQFLPRLKKQLPEGCAVIDDSTLQGPIAQPELARHSRKLSQAARADQPPTLLIISLTSAVNPGPGPMTRCNSLGPRNLTQGAELLIGISISHPPRAEFSLSRLSPKTVKR